MAKLRLEGREYSTGAVDSCTEAKSVYMSRGDVGYSALAG